MTDPDTLRKRFIKNPSIDKDLVERIYALSKIEVLDSIKRDFISWITVVSFVIGLLGIIGVNAVIEKSVETRVREQLDSLREKVQNTAIETQVQAKRIQDDTTQIQSFIQSFKERKGEIEQSIQKYKDSAAKISAARHNLEGIVTHGQDIAETLRRLQAIFYIVKSVNATINVHFKKNIQEVLTTSVATLELKSGVPIDLTKFPEILYQPLFEMKLDMNRSTKAQDRNSETVISLVIRESSWQADYIVAKLSLDFWSSEQMKSKPMSFLDSIDEVVLHSEP